MNVAALPDADALRALARSLSLAELGVRLGRSPGAVATLLRELGDGGRSASISLPWPQDAAGATSLAAHGVDAPPLVAPPPPPVRAPRPAAAGPAPGKDAQSAWAVEVQVGGQVVRRVVVAATLREAARAVDAHGFDEVLSVSHVGQMLDGSLG